MKIMRKTLIWFLTIIIVLCSSLLSCEKSYDDMMIDFVYENNNGKFNAIKIELGNGEEATYFINENYGLWINEKETVVFGISCSTSYMHAPRYLRVYKYSTLSYYKAIVEYSDSRSIGLFGEEIFNGHANFSDNGTVATFSENNIYANEMSIDSDQPVIMTKINIPANEILSFDAALNNMNYVPDAYFEFLTNQKEMKYSCELADWWVNASTMIGEWSTNGSIIPIRLKLHEKVPYVEIYDISESTERLILKSYANVVDGSKIELIEPEGEMFYSVPSAPVTITKTS